MKDDSEELIPILEMSEEVMRVESCLMIGSSLHITRENIFKEIRCGVTRFPIHQAAEVAQQLISMACGQQLLGLDIVLTKLSEPKITAFCILPANTEVDLKLQHVSFCQRIRLLEPQA